MDKIFNHKELAVDFLVPYLRTFSGVKEVAETNGQRWQTIEDCIWYILSNQNIDVATSYWLDLLGEKAGQGRQIYSIDPLIFTYGTDDKCLDFGKMPEPSIAESTTISLQDEVYRKYIKTAFLKNNYIPKRNEIINTIKILTGANRVWLSKKAPLVMEILIDVKIPQDYEQSYTEMIQSLIPQCITLDGIINGVLYDFVDEDGNNLIDDIGDNISGLEVA